MAECPGHTVKDRPVTDGERRGLELARAKIARQKKSLTQLGRAHQRQWNSYRDMRKEKDSFVASWHNASRMNSWLGEELRRAKGWTLPQLHKFMSEYK